MRTSKTLFAACVCLLLSNFSQAGEFTSQSSDLPCSHEVFRGYVTKYTSLNYISEPDRDGICYTDKVLLKARRGSNGGYYRYISDNSQNEFLRQEDGKFVKRDGNKIVLRMIVKEETGGAGDNRYWLLDFRGEEPIVAGPMPIDEKDWSRYYTVIWNDQSMVLIFDDVGTPFGTDRPRWTKTAYRYIDQALRQEGAEQNLSVILKNQMEPKVKKNEDPQAFAAYIYDYKGNRIIKSYIFNESYFR